MSGIQVGDITTDPTYYGPFHVKDVRLTSDKKVDRFFQRHKLLNAAQDVTDNLNNPTP